MLAECLLETNKEYKNLKKQEIQDIFSKSNWRKSAFSMIQLMEILTILLEQQLLSKYWVIKHLTLLAAFDNSTNLRPRK